MDDYKKALKQDATVFENYYKKSLVKTEQQKFLEHFLEKETIKPQKIADIACGGGTLSYHLKKIYPEAQFKLLDYNPSGIDIAKKINPESNFESVVGSIYELPYDSNQFDLTFCWQSLCMLDDGNKGLQELMRVTRPGGKIYISSLFNKNFDVDIYSQFQDLTLDSGKEGLKMNYYTYSEATIKKWLGPITTELELHEFYPTVDIKSPNHPKGTGTNTALTVEGKRLQISGGMLMNWGLLIAKKK